MELRGTLQSWNDDKGFGFIRPENDGAELFVHISAVRGDTRPQAGDEVMYLPGKDEQGRARATHMRHAGLSIDRAAIRRKPKATKPVAEKSASKVGSVTRRRQMSDGSIQQFPLKLVIFVLLILLPLWGSWWAQGVFWLLLIYPVLSVVSFCQYWYDKQQALKGGRRVPENTLHIAEIFGGWPGALIAQQVFRHKTRKLSFQLVFWLIVLAHQLFWIDQLILKGQYLGSWVN